MTVNDEVVKAAARLARHLEKAIADDAMTLPQYRVLAFLAGGDRAASKLAEWLSVSRPSVTALVDGLVEQGWVERKPSPTDRRSVLHELTEQGRSRYESATHVLADSLDELFGHLDDDERARAEDGLGLVHEALRRRFDAVAST